MKEFWMKRPYLIRCCCHSVEAFVKWGWGGIGHVKCTVVDKPIRLHQIYMTIEAAKK